MGSTPASCTVRATSRISSARRLPCSRARLQLLEVNIDLVKGEMQRYFDGQARLSQLSAEAALDAKQRIEQATSADLGSEAERGCGSGQGTSAPAGCLIHKCPGQLFGLVRTLKRSFSYP